jgi:ubiquinone/menaquinone biosynthesis C-methylase UbiE
MLGPPGSPPPNGSATVDWARIELPDAWPDRPGLRDLRQLWELGRRLLFRRPHPVKLPGELPGLERLPSYLLQEFHLLPNGNFSKTFTASYAIGFDKVMLGQLVKARALIADKLAGARRVLDVGTGAGHVAAALQKRGIPDVWALDPSPYLLQQTAREHPAVTCVQGVIEQSGLADQHFDGAAACFVFHEMPPASGDQALRELHRLLAPGARLVLVEPSAAQLQLSFRQVFQQHGWRGIYFKLLARGVFEPVLAAWHGRDHEAWFSAHGFRLQEDRDSLPWRMLVAERCG